MKAVDKILDQLETCISVGEYSSIETGKVELKDLSSGTNWNELHKTICAFLNSQGGIVIVGINENTKAKTYKFTGFRIENESKLKEIPNQFTDENDKRIDLSEYVRPDLFEIQDFLDGQICILPIEKLPEDKKYAFYKSVPYERKLTGDHKILRAKIERQKELREELELAKELETIESAHLDDLDVDKLNDYIQKLNQGIKVETLEADIASSTSFLERKRFIIKGKPTLLGILVCGKNIFDIVGSRCQVDGYVESPIQIAGNKKVFKDNIISLLENSVGFVYNNISTGISSESGGTTTFEYPERLIRETVNNALAHRDYRVNKFVNITISPGNHIEIKNPGKFREEQILRFDNDIPIRRIIPIPKAHNPRLTDVLKSFDRWEGKGWGMSSLTNMALDNKIDVPFYLLYSYEEVGLTIPKGMVLDEEAELWLKSFSGYIFRKTNGHDLSKEQKTVLAYFYKSERINRQEKYTIALTPDNNHFQVIVELEKWKLISKLPSKPEYDLYPTYVVERELTRENFNNELREILGGAFDNLGNHYRDTINAVFHLSTFGKNPYDVNAAQVGDFLYFRKHKKISDVENYNGYKRKIRNVIRSLTEKGFLVKREGSRPSYEVNSKFERTPSLFDT